MPSPPTASPPGYSYVYTPAGTGGDVTVIYNDNLSITQKPEHKLHFLEALYTNITYVAMKKICLSSRVC